MNRSADTRQEPTSGLPTLPDPLLISVGDLAKIVKLSPRSIWRLLNAGRIVAPVRIGGSVRWRYQDIKRWIDDGCPPVSTVSTTHGD